MAAIAAAAAERQAARQVTIAFAGPAATRQSELFGYWGSWQHHPQMWATRKKTVMDSLWEG